MSIWDSIGQIGGLLGGMGQFAGGMSGLFGGSGNQSFDAHDAYKMQVRQALYMPTYRRRGMEAAGYHPLAGLGISPASGITRGAFGGKDVGKAMANMGQGLQRAMTGKSKIDEAMARYYNALADEKERDKIPIEQDIQDPITEKGSVRYGPARRIKQSGPGFEAGEQGAVRTTFNPEGYLIQAPTEGLEDFASEDLLTKIKFHGPQLQRHWNSLTNAKAFNPELALKTRNDIREYLQVLTKAVPPPKGMYYTWSRSYGTPRRIPNNKYLKKQLFDTNNPNFKTFGLGRERLRRRVKMYKPFRTPGERKQRWRDFTERRKKMLGK